MVLTAIWKSGQIKFATASRPGPASTLVAEYDPKSYIFYPDLFSRTLELRRQLLTETPSGGFHVSEVLTEGVCLS